jgi:hypothetical protein
MPEVRAVDVAVHLDAHHAVTGVLGRLADERLLDRLGEARPARAGVELVATVETAVCHCTRRNRRRRRDDPSIRLERRLRALLPRDLELARREQLLPLRVGALHLRLAHVDDDVRRQAAGGDLAGFALEGILGGGRFGGFHLVVSGGEPGGSCAARQQRGDPRTGCCRKKECSKA